MEAFQVAKLSRVILNGISTFGMTRAFKLNKAMLPARCVGVALFSKWPATRCVLFMMKLRGQVIRSGKKKPSFGRPASFNWPLWVYLK
jgi:hypothetical protein